MSKIEQLSLTRVLRQSQRAFANGPRQQLGNLATNDWSELLRVPIGGAVQPQEQGAGDHTAQRQSRTQTFEIRHDPLRGPAHGRIFRSPQCRRIKTDHNDPAGTLLNQLRQESRQNANGGHRVPGDGRFQGRTPLFQTLHCRSDEGAKDQRRYGRSLDTELFGRCHGCRRVLSDREDGNARCRIRRGSQLQTARRGIGPRRGEFADTTDRQSCDEDGVR